MLCPVEIADHSAWRALGDFLDANIDFSEALIEYDKNNGEAMTTVVSGANNYPLSEIVAVYHIWWPEYILHTPANRPSFHALLAPVG